MARCFAAFALAAVALPGAQAVVLQSPPKKEYRYSITIPGRPVCAPTGGTCPSQLNMLRCAMRPHTTDIHAEMKVMEMPASGKVHTGFGPSYAKNVRYLLFDADDTSGFAGVKCTVQSAMSCKSGPVPSTNKCGDSKCVPDVRNPFLEYVRMQLGGSVAALAASRGRAEPSSAAVVGVGAGSLPSWLLAAFPRVTVDAVDIDASVVTIAADCFGLPKEDKRLQTHVEDGMHFMQKKGRYYDMVMLDVVPLPKPFRAMVSTAHDRLAAGGILAVNGWKTDKEFQGLQKDTMKAFSRVWLAGDHRGGGNQILLAIKGRGAGLRDAMPTSKELEAMGAPKDAATWSSQYEWKKLV